ncbi:MAG: SIMPL domain-containing protein [Treponema sp.]|nr:SIMPL domain-containing protein [Treponema sp.]
MKKVIKKSCVLLLSALLFNSCYIQKESVQERTINVTGTGTQEAPADMASVEFTVVTAGWSAKQIAQDNDTLSSRLIESVKKVGISENDISWSECAVSMPSSQYEARKTVKVITRNLELVPAIVDCKIPGSQVRLGKIEFSVSDKTKVLREARTAAVKNAHETAALLSGASGCKIGDASYISDGEITTETSSDGKIVTTVKIFVSYVLQ